MTPIQYRRQNDGQQPRLSEEAQIFCTAAEDMARQEFADEADINKILGRFGIDAFVKKPEFGEQDFDLDLYGALDAMAKARTAFGHLPTALKHKYRNWKNFLNAAEQGGLTEEEIRIYSPQPESAGPTGEPNVSTSNPDPQA